MDRIRVRTVSSQADLLGVGSLQPPSEFVAHRTGGKLGEEVSEQDKNSQDPTNYLILVNDDYEEDSPDGEPDNSNDTAIIPTGSASGDEDDDLAQITLKALPPGLTEGKVKIVLSDPSAVRLFRSDGSLLYKEGETSEDALTLDLSSPSGYLAGLLSGDVDVWLEGLHKDSDFVFAVIRENASGQVILGDDIHMMIGQWTFRGYDGGEILDVSPVWKEALLAGVQRESELGSPLQITDDPEGSFYKIDVEGLHYGLESRLRVASDSDPSDYYDDEFVGLPDRMVSKGFAALYSSDDVYLADPDTPVTADERAAIKQALGLNAVHNPGMTATLSTGPEDDPRDVQTRKLTVRNFVKIALVDDVVNVGGRIRGVVFAPNVNEQWTFEVWTSDGQGPIVGRDNAGNGLNFDFAASASRDITLYVRGGPKVMPGGFPPGPGTNPRPFGNSALIRVLPAGGVMPTWQQQAWQALRVNGVVPGTPINRNRRISELYALIYNSETPQPLGGGAGPTAFEWAGTAAFASNLAGDGMAEAEWFGMAPFAQTLIAGIDAPDPRVLLKYLGQGNLAIFMDLYSQMLAYQSGGLTEIENMAKRREINSPRLRAWRLIDDGLSGGDDGKVWQGTLLLAKVEQGETLQAVLDQDKNLWIAATKWKTLVAPIPGDDSTFQQFRLDEPDIPDDTSFGDGTIYGDPNDEFDSGVARYLWYARRMIPAWKENANAWRKTNGMIDVDKLLKGGYKQQP